MHNFNEKKYKILKKESIIINGITVYRIEALKSFNNVKEGDIGGFIESYDNLSQEGNCWVYGDSSVYDNAHVCGDSKIMKGSIIKSNTYIRNSEIKCESIISDNSVIDSSEIINSNILDASIKDLKINGGNITSKNDYIVVKGLGSRNDRTVFYLNKYDKILVTCGCFFGTLKEFKKQVKYTHADNKKFKNEYLGMIKIVKEHFKDI